MTIGLNSYSGACAQDPDEMSYYDSARGVIISRERAIQELQRHGMISLDDLLDFDAEVGLKNFYDAQDVLGWLGY